jgi:hypothetical protein
MRIASRDALGAVLVLTDAIFACVDRLAHFCACVCSDRCVWDEPSSTCHPEVPCNERNEETCPCVETTCRNSTSFDCMQQNCIWSSDGSGCRAQKCLTAPDDAACTAAGCVSGNVSFCTNGRGECAIRSTEALCDQDPLCAWKTEWACQLPQIHTCGDAGCGSARSFCMTDADCCTGLQCNTTHSQLVSSVCFHP